MRLFIIVLIIELWCNSYLFKAASELLKRWNCVSFLLQSKQFGESLNSHFCRFAQCDKLYIGYRLLNFIMLSGSLDVTFCQLMSELAWSCSTNDLIIPDCSLRSRKPSHVDSLDCFDKAYVKCCFIWRFSGALVDLRIKSDLTFLLLVRLYKFLISSFLDVSRILRTLSSHFSSIYWAALMFKPSIFFGRLCDIRGG